MNISLSEFETITRTLIANNELADGNSFVCDLIYSRHRFMDACDPATILKLLAVVRAAKRLVTATYTIADTGCFNAADDAVKQAENALTALESL